MRKVIKLTEKDLEKVIRTIIKEQGEIQLPPKELKSVIEPQKAAQIKSQANVLSNNTEMMRQTLLTLKMMDPEGYHMLTGGKDPLGKRNTLGDAVIATTLISLIYAIVQEVKGN